MTAPIGRSGPLVDAAVSAGATGVSGPSLALSDQDALYAVALKNAVANAQAKAKAIADATGLQLGAVQTVVEGSSSTPIVYSAAGAKDAPASTRSSRARRRSTRPSRSRTPPASSVRPAARACDQSLHEPG